MGSQFNVIEADAEGGDRMTPTCQIRRRRSSPTTHPSDLLLWRQNGHTSIAETVADSLNTPDSLEYRM